MIGGGTSPYVARTTLATSLESTAAGINHVIFKINGNERGRKEGAKERMYEEKRKGRKVGGKRRRKGEKEGR